MNKTELFLARRFLIHSRKGTLPILVLFSILGVLLGTGTMLVVNGVMTGFHHELKARILGMTPHVIVHRFFDAPISDWQPLVHEIQKMPEVKAAGPYLLTKVMVRAKDYVDGAVVRGVPQDGGVKGPELQKSVVMGEFDLRPGHVLLGSALAAQLRVMPGDTLELLSPVSAVQTPLGTILEPKQVVVSGIFDAGLYDYNATLILGNLRDVQDLIDWQSSILGIEVDLQDPYRAKAFATNLEQQLGYPYQVLSWTDLNRSLFAALSLEKLAMFLVLILMVVIASFSIIATLTIMVTQKTREIGILRSLGFSRRQVLRIFLWVGIVIGVLGILLGLLVGYGVAAFIQYSGFVRLPPEVYFIDYLPVLIRARDVFLIVVSALVVVVLASLLPARRAANLDPVEAIRYE